MTVGSNPTLILIDFMRKWRNGSRGAFRAPCLVRRGSSSLPFCTNDRRVFLFYCLAIILANFCIFICIRISKMGSKLKYTEEHIEEIKEMLKEKRPIHEIARKLGIKYVTLIRHLRTLEIPYEKNPQRKGIAHREVRKDSWYYLGTENYINSKVLKKKLIEDGIKEYKCERCGNTEWNGKPIPLELHHINGDHTDNRLENLIILCSNCHSQEHEYCKNMPHNKR